MERSSTGLHDIGALFSSKVLPQSSSMGICWNRKFSQYGFAAIPLDEIITPTVLSPEEIVDKIKNKQIGHSSIDFTESSSSAELHEFHAAQSSDSKSTEEICESCSSDPNSTAELHELHAAQSSDPSQLKNSMNLMLHNQSSDSKSTEEICEPCSSDPKSTAELYELHAAQSSDSKSTEELHELHAAQSSDSKSTDEVYETTNTTQYAKAR